MRHERAILEIPGSNPATAITNSFLYFQTTNRYICDSKGNVICQPGWKEPDVETELNFLNPCLEPVCQGGCKHGRCKAPDYCACDIGW